jgi:hypothetical protein
MQEKYISGEEHQRINSVDSNHKAKSSLPLKKTLIYVAILVVVAVLAFWGGIAYQKGKHTTSTNTTSAARGFGAGRAGFGGMTGDRVIGTVTAISSNSISLTSRFNGSTSTLAINSSTKITDNDQTVSTSDIKTGDNVFITKTSATSTTASVIIVNPSFGGGMGGGANQPAGSSTGSSTSVGSTTSGSSTSGSATSGSQTIQN